MIETLEITGLPDKDSMRQACVVLSVLERLRQPDLTVPRLDYCASTDHMTVYMWNSMDRMDIDFSYPEGYCLIEGLPEIYRSHVDLDEDVKLQIRLMGLPVEVDNPVDPEGLLKFTPDDYRELESELPQIFRRPDPVDAIDPRRSFYAWSTDSISWNLRMLPGLDMSTHPTAMLIQTPSLISDNEMRADYAGKLKLPVKFIESLIANNPINVDYLSRLAPLLDPHKFAVQLQRIGYPYTFSSTDNPG